MFVRRIPGVILLCFVLAGCSKRAQVTVLTVSGRYGGRYFDGEESFEMRPDGTYSQVFQRGGKVVYTNSGTWILRTNQTIVLRPFVGLTDPSIGGARTGASNRFESMIAVFEDDPDRLEFGEWPYFVTRRGPLGSIATPKK